MQGAASASYPLVRSPLAYFSLLESGLLDQAVVLQEALRDSSEEVPRCKVHGLDMCQAAPAPQSHDAHATTPRVSAYASSQSQMPAAARFSACPLAEVLSAMAAIPSIAECISLQQLHGALLATFGGLHPAEAVPANVQRLAAFALQRVLPQMCVQLPGSTHALALLSALRPADSELLALFISLSTAAAIDLSAANILGFGLLPSACPGEGS